MNAEQNAGVCANAVVFVVALVVVLVVSAPME
jgi:hypothetical protein